ncbi:PepSY domain-containing protein [Xanthobacter sp. V4C-4]|uniref:PepSY domain-containing protein n=1 Tax=Xanthobacter cornucopiae TaxID=3119924 RepID=UPI00372CD05E
MTRFTWSTAAALCLLASQALAQTPPAEKWRSTADIATHLAENGFIVLKLDREHDGFEAELVDRQGNKVEARVHPVTAEILSSRDDGRAAARQDQWLTLPQVARQLENKGFVVRAIDTEATGYEADLTDPAGARTEVRIDPRTGAVLSSKPD